MKDRTNEEGIDPVTDGPTDDARRRGESESRHGGKHGAPQERTMIEEILEPGNLAEAWKRVKANKGAPGIDGMTVGDFPAFARKEWPRTFGGDDRINGKTVDYSNWPALDSPWTQQKAVGGPLTVTDGKRIRIYDFERWTVKEKAGTR